ncbi:MAG: 30S ribosomal protein S21 [Anaerolineae bacterium]|nr:30S ribosomal protein S21 [Anaerolineae bacterium]
MSFVTGSASAVPRCSFVTRVAVRPTENFDSALRRFNRKVRHNTKRPWYKRRYGYYEKPSALKRKRRKMQRRNWRHNIYTRVICPIGLDKQFRRTGRNAVGE